MVSADKPLVDPADDAFDYAPYAKSIALNIQALTKSTGLVIAINGTWGSGKTTMVNFVTHYLNQLKEDERPSIFFFNPWWFTGREDLIRAFFAQLQTILGEKRLFSDQTKEHLAELAEALSSVTKGAGSYFANKLKKKLNVTRSKEKLSESLKKSERKILVIIDDLDRLTPEEIAQIFALVKGVGDLPNVVYILAFDRDVLAKGLSTVHQTDGEAFIEKIIQIPLQLPTVEKIHLRKLLFSKLNVITENTPPELFGKSRWQNMYFQGIDHLLRTPRDIIRLTNSLSFNYPSVRGEVNCPDFISIESIRIFLPEIYDVIRNNPDLFAGAWEPDSRRSMSLDNFKQFHLSWMNRVPENLKGSLKKFSTLLFPKLSVVWGSGSYGIDWLPNWRRHLLVCSPDVFATYFRLSVPSNSISYSELKSTLNAAQYPQQFSNILTGFRETLRPDGKTKLHTFLETVIDFLDQEVERKVIAGVLFSLFEIADELHPTTDEPKGWFDISNSTFINSIISKLLDKLPEADRFEILRERITNGKALSLMVNQVLSFSGQHGRFGGKQKPSVETILTLPHVEALEGLCSDRIIEFAKSDRLLDVGNLWLVLKVWQNSARQNELKEWLSNVVENDLLFPLLLEKLIQAGVRERSKGTHEVEVEEFFRLDPEWFKPYIDPKEVVQRARSIAPMTSLTSKQRKAVEQLLKESEMREKGDNPEETNIWE